MNTNVNMLHIMNKSIFILLLNCIVLLNWRISCNALKNDEYHIPISSIPVTRGLLYPRESESREVRSLDGLWRFLRSDIADPMQGVREKWYTKSLDQVGETIQMPVPSSYNDITVEAELRDHVGTVWYEREFFVPQRWSLDQRVWLRFGSVNYAAIVWLNGKEVLQHKIGHLPFAAEITEEVKFGAANRLTVICDNTLTNITIPQGLLKEEPTDNGTAIMQTYSFDFFNYAGIHRTVHLYTTPAVYIDDLSLNTEVLGNGTGAIYYNVSISGDHANLVNDDALGKDNLLPLYIHLQLRDKKGEIVTSDTIKQNKFNSVLYVKHVKPWWPYLMHKEPGYLYQLELYLHANDNSLLDVYRIPVGIRSLSWNASSLLINGVPVYMRGFGRHEDADIRGKGFDYALLIHDFNLMKWVGANAYRTSHYPYSEESMQLADEHGIMIIDECSGVDIDIFDAALLQNHMVAIEQLVHRDRNHASVVAWSIANEPRSAKPKSNNYFKLLTNYTRSIAAGRPLTAAINANYESDNLGQYLDIISFNRYNAWYQNAGRLNMIKNAVFDEAYAWHKKHGKPVIMTEYGADTMEGFHALPSYIWSEDYQSALFSKHFAAFDALRQEKWFIGEFVWNFADFKTEQTTTRVGGNKKGIFTRARQPKAAAKLLRKRYYSLANELHGVKLPEDLFCYIFEWQ